MMGMAAVSEQLVLTLIGEKWLPAAEYLNLLCFSGVFFPFQSANMNVIKVQAEMSSLLLELFKFILLGPVLLLGGLFGIKEMLFGLIVHSIVYFLISAKISSKLIGYQINNYLKDLLPFFFLSFIMYLIVNVFLNILKIKFYFELLVGLIIGIFLMILLYEIFKVNNYLEAKNYIIKSFFIK